MSAPMLCRHCGGTEFVPFLDLGRAPPSNSYLANEAAIATEKTYPLVIRTCTACRLTQTEDFAEREEFFSADYAYFSSFSKSWLDHARSYVEAMRARFGLDAGSLVCEVAANDGYLLRHVKAAGIPCYGIEPTASTAKAARALGIDIVEKFFGADLAGQLSGNGRQADLIAANNVLAHVPDIDDFARGFALLLKPEGVATFEFPHLLEMVRGSQFDTAYHEHYSYLSLMAVERVFAVAGLRVFDVGTTPWHGGSLRVFACREGAKHVETPAVDAMRRREAEAGMAQDAFYTGFQQEAERLRDELIAFLADARQQGMTVAAYGAAAKGNTLLNFAGVTANDIAFVVDLNPAKQGRLLPGSHIQIVDEAHLHAARPERVVILPWNIESEIRTQLAYIEDWGGKFVTAIPRLTVHP
jgi:SAM-dependent methyltransferase